MVKNTLNKILLTDEYEGDEKISFSDKKIKQKEDSKLNDFIKSELNEKYLDYDESESPKIEFIVEEDENKEKQIRMNFEFTIGDSNELFKIDLEISKTTYLEIANELLK
tara:strand:+ start:192 stop:518 length:327 start_codon:yes stop_codon:yes gene_type:complete